MAEIMVRFNDLRRYCENRHCGSVPLEYIKQMRTVEAEPIKHGRLIKTHLKGYYKCSACMLACTSNPDQRFCSYCGAKLDGGVEE